VLWHGIGEGIFLRDAKLRMRVLPTTGTLQAELLLVRKHYRKETKKKLKEAKSIINHSSFGSKKKKEKYPWQRPPMVRMLNKLSLPHFITLQQCLKPCYTHCLCQTFG
jgi:hypothetical protein